MFDRNRRSDLERESKKHERQLQDLEKQQKLILDSVRRDTAKLESQRQHVLSQLERERLRLEGLEDKINHLKPTANNMSDESDCDEVDQELENKLRRLELLDKTQDEVEKLSKAVIKLKDSNNSIKTEFSAARYKGSPLLVLQQQKQIAEELNKVIKAMNKDKGVVSSKMATSSLNSAGSEEGSLCTVDSDPHTERLYFK